MARLFASRRPIPPQAAPRTSTKTFPAPTGGWQTNKNLAMDGPMTARLLDNWFPTRTGIRCRGGSTKHATVHASNPVVTMWTYVGANEQLFAATADSIFEITSPADPNVAPTADITSQTSGYYSTQMFSTAGGIFQYVVNGADLAQLYDGSAWTQITGVSTPAITGVTTSTLSAVWAHQNRLWFVQNGTMKAWYLPVDSVGGAAVSFLLSGVFRRGGVLLFGTTWSLDTGDGMDDKAVFVTDRGEVAVYSGTDPSSASTWGLEGVYYLGGDMMGKNAFFHIGGEPYFLTAHGIVPLSEAMRRDVSQLELGNLTLPIEDEWQAQTQLRNTSPWHCVTWPWAEMLIIGMPQVAPNDDPYCYASNLTTGAWARFTNWDVNSVAAYSYFGYFGTSDGKVYQMDIGGSDGGTPYTCALAMHFDHLDAPNATKTLRQARALFKTGNVVLPRLSASVDYKVNMPTAPSSPANFSVGDVWDSGIWDTAIWDDTTLNTDTETTYWQSIGKTGFAHSIQLQLTWGTTSEPNTELLTIDVTHEPGAMVV